MPKPEQIQDDRLRPLLQDAHRAVREGDPAATVHRCAEAYLLLCTAYPQLLLPASAEPLAQVPSRSWPELGASLVVEEGQPSRIAFHREEFSLSEALTYYDFTLKAVLAAERVVATAAEGTTSA